MRRLAEKIAVIALIFVTLIFALTAILYMSNVIPQYGNYASNGVFTILYGILCAVFVLLSGYLLYVNFSTRENLKKMTLYSNAQSATLTNVKVVKKIINSCAKQTGGIAVKKCRIKTDENNGFALYLKVNVTADTVAQPIDTFHCLLADSFQNVLGIAFNSINFEVARLSTGYVPSDKHAQQKADEMAEYREQDQEHYVDPLPEYPYETDGEDVTPAAENADSADAPSGDSK